MNDGTCRSSLEFLDYYYRNGKENSLSLTLNSTCIEVYLVGDNKKRQFGLRKQITIL